MKAFGTDIKNPFLCMQLTRPSAGQFLKHGRQTNEQRREKKINNRQLSLPGRGDLHSLP